MDHDATHRADTPLLWNRDMDQPRWLVGESKQLSGRFVTERGTGPRSPHRRPQQGLSSGAPVREEVHTAMKPLPALGSNQSIDSVGGQPEAEGLVAGYHSLLMPGQVLARP